MNEAQRRSDTAETHTGNQLDHARRIVERIPDPELPFVTLVDLGIVRDIQIDSGVVIVRVSPTYSGCPAVQAIEASIDQQLADAGFTVRIERVLSPAWTTDWITTRGRRRLLANGIAPPNERSPSKPVLFAKSQVQCPHCGADDTRRVSEFGSTPCKAQYQCRECLEPFDYFKCL